MLWRDADGTTRACSPRHAEIIFHDVTWRADHRTGDDARRRHERCGTVRVEIPRLCGPGDVVARPTGSLSTSDVDEVRRRIEKGIYDGFLDKA